MSLGRYTHRKYMRDFHMTVCTYPERYSEATVLNSLNWMFAQDTWTTGETDVLMVNTARHLDLTKRLSTMSDHDYMIGQRVILNKTEIGTVVVPQSESDFGIWVHSPSRGFASSYALDNVKPLPDGQL